MLQTLTLNKGGVPINVISWDEALKKCNKTMYEEQHNGNIIIKREKKAIAVIWHEEEILKQYGISCMVPSVIQYRSSDFVPKNYTNIIPFNRKNLWIRDGGRCMYCNKKVGLSSFTFEHVVPKMLGGLNNWENIVVACMRCNSKKGCKTLKESGMNLIRKPYIPRLSKSAPRDIINKIGNQIPYKTWADFIYWNSILEE